ncbi:MAG: LysR family transcriptional regulator [Phascolarctobacterium sp.]|nr:LysR family transcriptional regulator [Phascolarctobacterium sp.]
MYNKHLETFIEVADSGSFTKAAEKLFISPNAVIKQINIFEDKLELKLFERTHRGLKLTPAGESLYRDAKYLIQYAGDSLVRARKAAGRDDNLVRIGTSLITPTQFLMELWPHIQTIHPDLKFKLVPFNNTPENAKEIMKHFGENIDMVAGVYDDSMLAYRECRASFIKEIPVRIAVSAHSKLAQKTQLALSDLYGKTLYIQDKTKIFLDIEAWLNKNHPQITTERFTFYDVSVFDECVNSDKLLIAFDIWSQIHPMIKILPVEWDFTMAFGILHATNPSPNVKKFISGLRKNYK